VCHYSVTTDGTTVADRTLHVNGALNVVQAGGATALHQFSYAAGSCSTANCHGGNTVAWSLAGPIACDICHGEVGGAVTNTDVNNFAWDGTTQSKIAQSEYAADGGGHGDGVGGNAPNKVCAACHDSAVAHDTTGALTGANPFRLVDQDGGTAGVQYACSYNGAGCHTAGTTGPATGLDISTFVTHSNEEMTSTGYTPKRTWPAWDPQCVNCHDPHGDGANLSMIQREMYDKGAFPIPGGGTPWTMPTEQTALVFTDNATGASAAGTSFADLDAPYSSVCQECHEDPSMVSFHDDTTASGANHPSPGGNPGDCSACHKHSSAFSPSACEGCHDGSVALAPNVIDGTAPWNAAVSYNWTGSAAGQDGGHGDPDGQPAVACTDCHDTGQPPGNFHLNGTYESIWDNATRNTNTAHLKAAFFDTGRATPPPPVGSGTWDVQVAFDNYCAGQCHPGQGVAVMWHERDTLASDPNHWSVELGTHFTQADGDALPYPVDADLNTGANIADVDYAPCVSCHDPHGTTVVEPTRTSNRMVRDKWTNPPTLCSTCHL